LTFLSIFKKTYMTVLDSKQVHTTSVLFRPYRKKLMTIALLMLASFPDGRTGAQQQSESTVQQQYPHGTIGASGQQQKQPDARVCSDLGKAGHEDLFHPL
jgi:hypothetical protein